MTTNHTPAETPTTTTSPAACPYCGGVGTLRPQNEPITRKRRVKFGVLWLLFTICTGGLALLLYMVWPRRNERTGVHRYTLCTRCRATF